MKVFSLALLSALLILFSAGCKKEEPDVQTPASKLRGKVVLENEYGQVQLTDRAGTQVVISALYQIPTQTDNSGRFEFAGLDDDTYTLQVSREGYTPAVIHGINFSKNHPNYPVNGDYQELPSITLTKKSVSHFDSTLVEGLYDIEVTIDTINDTVYTFIDTLSADLHFRSLRVGPVSFNPQAKFGYRLFLGKTANVGPSNYLATYHGVTVEQEMEIDWIWTQQQWQNMGLSFDEPVFIKIYGDAVNPVTNTNASLQTTFPNLSDSLGVDSTIIHSFL